MHLDRKFLLRFLVGLSMLAVFPAYAGDANVLCVQQQLLQLEHDPGTPDGVMGNNTRRAAAAYLASAPADAALGEFTVASAATWCETLAKLDPALAGFAEARPNDELIVGDGVSQRQIAAIERGLAEAHGFLGRHFDYRLERPVRAFASTDATWLTENYLEVKNLNAGFRAGKMREFGACEPAAEGGYYVMFLCMGSDAWSRGSMPRGGADAETMAIVMHEYTHNLQFGLVGERGKDCCTDSDAMSVFGPQWLVEGSAEYLRFMLMDELGYMDLDRSIRDTTKFVRRGDVNLLTRESRKGFREGENSWPLGIVATHHLVADAGLYSLVQFWRRIGEGAEMQDAFGASFGVTTAAFALEFAKSLKPDISDAELEAIASASPDAVVPAHRPSNASPVDNMACVQKQFRILGYYDGAVDGLISPVMIEASKRYIDDMKRDHPGWQSPVLSSQNAGDWCEHVADANPRVAEFWEAVR